MKLPSTLENALDRSVTFLRTANGKFVLTVVTSSAATAAVILLTFDYRRRTARRRLRDDVERVQSKRPASPASTSEKRLRSAELTPYGMPVRPPTRIAAEEEQEVQIDDSLIREQLARNLAFLGEEGLQRVRNSFVIVVGLGGVGSAAATMLCRSGVGRLRIIDFDQVTLSSLNRHATATLADVGTPKVESAKAYFRRIAPWVKVEARNDLFRLQDADDLLSGEPDFVFDAIDNITSKVNLLQYCHERKIRVISSSGAASKADPSRIQIADISMTFEDPLARAMRRRLRLEGVASGVPVVYSTEKASDSTKLLPLDEEEFKKGNVGELSALEAFRVRILPVLGPIPGMFGQAAAAHILTQLAGFPTSPLPIKNRYKTYKRAWQLLLASETRMTGNSTIGLTEEDVAYLLEEVHCGRSVVAPLFNASGQPHLLRWDPSLPLAFDNIACFSADEAKLHTTHVLQAKDAVEPEAYWGEATAGVQTRRMTEERALRRWRV